MSTFLYPYKGGSQGARALSQALGIKRVKRRNSRFRPRPNKTLINWGNGSLPESYHLCNVINEPSAVNKAGNKLLTFQCLSQDENINIPEFSTSVEDAEQWIEEGNKVVCRQQLRGHSGQGIVLSSSMDDLVDAPLYVKYVPKTQEYRVHVAFGDVVDQQRKARRHETPDEQVNWQIRNHDNGFIFMREGVQLPAEGLGQALWAVAQLGLDFGAVDLIYNERQDRYYVLEINTAPGLTGTTLENYVEVFREKV
ncbi:putative ATP-grasp protein [Salinivibrio phage CW02]|uniref:Putative ATP-grasp protein n=1 Tax=Salinivibrio phage CW02 TaxID=1161935 RepID=H9D1D6_9CAUD|nr:ribosomal protein S6 glutaminyl transferase [Salinivibrio phage CW02]AFE86178.1 putative ATP-grasp protein [Salinivibrio phage CW02]